ncbi:MAG TPA: hypothetical protein VLH56_12290, partial [Dissulfurispiraceae bacterium]|nr:hypothetical protein [Dissulfurispiraceae bacterium]HSW64068.1 hypothetical protein [Dissulfurispiraceae bacterium]
TMSCVMLAYTLMSLFRHVVVCSKTYPTLKTLRCRIFATSGYLVKDGNRRILKLCLAMKRRQWFEGLWGWSKSFNLPASFPSLL